MHKRQFLKNIMLTTLGTPIGIACFAKSFENKASLIANELAVAAEFVQIYIRLQK
jgi:hypothetical protein